MTIFNPGAWLAPFLATPLLPVSAWLAYWAYSTGRRYSLTPEEFNERQEQLLGHVSPVRFEKRRDVAHPIKAS